MLVAVPSSIMAAYVRPSGIAVMLSTWMTRTPPWLAANPESEDCHRPFENTLDALAHGAGEQPAVAGWIKADDSALA